MKRGILFIWVLCSMTAAAQDYDIYYDKMYLVGVAVNVPLSNTDFVGKPSARGIRLGYREMINDQVMAGIDLHSYAFNDYVDRQTYYNNGGALTTDFYKFANSYGATFAFEYYLFADKKVMPYIGLGLGAARNNFKVYYNLYSDSRGSWGFLARPQIGAWMKVGKKGTFALHASVQSDICTSQAADFGYYNFNNVGLQVGFVVLDW